MKTALNLGAWRQLDGAEGGPVLNLPARHLVTHAVVVGMTGSGKTGLVTVLIEEAARAQVPTLVIDVKGDLPNLLLTFPDFKESSFLPWVEREREEEPPEQLLTKCQRPKATVARSSSLGHGRIARGTEPSRLDEAIESLYARVAGA